MNSKHCPHCHFSTKIVKIGQTSSGRQRYKCKMCGKSWVAKPHSQVLAKSIWYDLVFHNMNMTELAQQYKISERTIRRKLNLYQLPELVPSPAKVIAMDVTYFGRSGGILSVINAHTGDLLYCEPTGSYETVWDYEKAILSLHKYNVFPEAAIVDGKKGVISMLQGYGIKVQLCQFHQLKTITQCLTRNPILTPNIELRNIALSLTRLNKEAFSTMVCNWKVHYETWLREKVYRENKHWEYKHKSTRRAINSLVNNMPYLFTFEEYPELNIPNTNNKIEGIHSELKRRLANHRGLKMSQKIQFVRIFLSRRTGV